MKSNSLKLVAAVALIVAAGSAAAQSAQTQNFTGPALGVSISALTNKVALTSQVASLNGQAMQGNDTSASLLGSWGFALSDKWVATVGLSLDLNSTDAGKVNYTSGGTQTLSAKTKEHMSLSIAPGYRLSPDLLVYGKLAYHQLKGEYTDTATTTSTTNHNGTGYGLGLALALTPQTEMRIEYESVQYNAQTINTTSGKPEQTLFTLGLLYKF